MLTHASSGGELVPGFRPQQRLYQALQILESQGRILPTLAEVQLDVSHDFVEAESWGMVNVDSALCAVAIPFNAPIPGSRASE